MWQSKMFFRNLNFYNKEITNQITTSGKAKTALLQICIVCWAVRFANVQFCVRAVRQSSDPKPLLPLRAKAGREK